MLHIYTYLLTEAVQKRMNVILSSYNLEFVNISDYFFLILALVMTYEPSVGLFFLHVVST